MIEAIICTQCGSGGVQEVKPNTFFCNHCETVFKHTPPQTAVGANPGGCQVDDCGVPAIGRCWSCRRRFCLTHQGVDFGSHRGDVRTRHLDRCGPCHYEETHRPDARLVTAYERVKTAGTAEELMGALAAPMRFRGKGALPIDSALVLDAWRRLGAAHQLPETSLELARVTHRQAGKSLIKKRGATVYIFDCAEAERLGPVWSAPLALKRYGDRHLLDAVVDREGMIYRVSFDRGMLNPFNITESLVATTVGESLGLSRQAKCTTSGLPINGDQVMLANYDDERRTAGVFMGKLEPAAFSQVAYNALEHHGVTPAPVGPASPPSHTPTARSSHRASSARAAHVQSLVAADRLSPEQAGAMIVNGRVSDRDWERVRDL